MEGSRRSRGGGLEHNGEMLLLVGALTHPTGTTRTHRQTWRGVKKLRACGVRIQKGLVRACPRPGLKDNPCEIKWNLHIVTTPPARPPAGAGSSERAAPKCPGSLSPPPLTLHLNRRAPSPRAPPPPPPRRPRPPRTCRPRLVRVGVGVGVGVRVGVRHAVLAWLGLGLGLGSGLGLGLG